MKRSTNITFCLCLILLFNFPIYGQKWIKNIYPIEKNISELDSVFGKNTKNIIDDKISYKLKEGNLFIWFSQGRCISGGWGTWNVEKGTIISIVFYPKKKFPPSHYDLETDTKKNSKRLFHSIKDDTKGVFYETESGKVTRIHYYPSNQFIDLKCNSK